MKKYLLITAIMLSFAAAYSQPHFGVKAGVNIANLNFDDGPDYESKVGFHGGFLAHFHVAPHFAIQPEVVYSLQGAKFDESPINQKIDLSYINVPVMFQYMFNNGFRLQTGPQAGFLVSAESEINDVEVDIDDEVETFDFSWGFGVGYISKSRLGIDARYNLGLTNVLDNALKAKNSVFQIGLFYQFKHR